MHEHCNDNRFCMKKIKICFFLLFALPTITWAAECKLTDLNDPIKVVIEFQKCDQLAPSVFSSYKSSDFPFVLTGLNGDFNSIVIVEKGVILQTLKLSQALKIQNGLYEFHNPDSSEQGINIQLNSYLANLNLKEALIWNIGMNFNLQDTPISSWGIKIHLALMVHEGFHFFVQQLFKVPINWPKTHLGISNEVRTQMQENCFNLNSKVRNLASLERQKILEAFNFSQSGDDVNAKLKAIEFVEVRNLRYNILTGIEINDLDFSILSCQEAENVASIVEGIPEFVGIATLLKLGLLAPQEVTSYFPEKDTALYYRFPLFQALLLTSTSTTGKTSSYSQSNFESVNQAGTSFEFKKTSNTASIKLNKTYKSPAIIGNRIIDISSGDYILNCK